MPQKYISDSGAIVIPGAYSSYKVQPSAGGLATTGVLMLVGEAESGPGYASEDALEDNLFGPDQEADVVAKYKSGPLVDAFRHAVGASADPAIAGSFSSALLVKTNQSTKATCALTKYDNTSYGTLADKGYGSLGNLIYAKIETGGTSDGVAEVPPTTGKFSFVPPIDTGKVSFTVNGVATHPAYDVSFTQYMIPSAFATAVDGVTGIDIGTARTPTTQGGKGENKTVLPAGPATVTLTKGTGNNVTLTTSSTWAVPVFLGDVFIIDSTAPANLRNPAGGATDENIGCYIVTANAAVSDPISAVKVNDYTALTLTAPATTLAVTVNVAATDIRFYDPVEIKLPTATNPADGIAKTLEVVTLTALNNALIDDCAYELGTATKVDWISTTALPTVITGTQYKPSINISRSTDSVNETIVVGGEIGLLIGYTNNSATAATITITSTTLSTTVTGVSNADISVNLSEFPTITELATYINSLTDYVAMPNTVAVGQLSPTYLDRVSAQGILAQKAGAYTGQVKTDAWRFFRAISEESATVQLGSTDPARADAGIPKPMSTTKFTGGTKAATTDALVTSALAAIEYIPGNFVIPLFSRDATDDKLDGLTDSSSTYTIAGIHLATKTHVLKVSTMKRKKSRQGLLSIRDTFDNAKTAAQTMAHPRMFMTFEDVKVLGSTGSVVQAQPWMAAVNAGAMQAAGFYRGIVNKLANVTGALQAAGDWKGNNDSNVEEALIAGLNPIRKDPKGGYRWVSDQTTYSADDTNFVFNSLQAVYVADIIAATLAEKFEATFVGQSVADVSAAQGLNYLESMMAEFLRIKIITPSSDAQKGFKNASVRIVGPVMTVTCEVKLAGLIYFVPIFFTISMVTQTA